MKKILACMVAILLFTLVSKQMNAQNVIINASAIDGVDITKENIFSYQIISSLKSAVDAQISGSIIYRGLALKMGYSFSQRIQPGINVIDASTIHPSWTYSQNALQELFVNYNTLPAGTYQYCIKVIPKNIVGETDPGNVIEECIYHKNQELFLINLIEPDNNAKIYEHNPVLTWVANYSFSNELTYKIRVAEIKQGQNTENAITRNNPIYQESNLHQNTLIYPLTAKQLEVYQPYAWTVDAYYKGILLGGAEPWKFTIIEDSIQLPIPKESSYIDIELEHGENQVFAIDFLKLKYTVVDLRQDTLSFSLYQNDKPIQLKNSIVPMKSGENKLVYPIASYAPLKHRKSYLLKVVNRQGKEFKIIFVYINSSFL